MKFIVLQFIIILLLFFGFHKVFFISLYPSHNIWDSREQHRWYYDIKKLYENKCKYCSLLRHNMALGQFMTIFNWPKPHTRTEAYPDIDDPCFIFCGSPLSGTCELSNQAYLFSVWLIMHAVHIQVKTKVCFLS